MDEESDEELEDRDEVMEPRVYPSSSSEDDAEETEVEFQATRAGDWSNFLNFTGPQNSVSRSAASDINAESFPFSIFILFLGKSFKLFYLKKTLLPSVLLFWNYRRHFSTTI